MSTFSNFFEFMNLNLFDICIIGLIVFSCLSGLIHGFIKEIASFGAIVFSFFVSTLLMDEFSIYFQKYFTLTFSRFFTFISIFLSVYLFCTIIRSIIGLLTLSIRASLFSKFLGAIIGFLRGFVISVVLIFTLSNTTACHQSWYKNSVLIKEFKVINEWLIKRVKLDNVLFGVFLENDNYKK